MTTKVSSKTINSNINYIKLYNNNPEIEVFLYISKSEYSTIASNEIVINKWIHDTILKTTGLEYRI